RILGADHPDTLASRHDLADAYQAAGRPDAPPTVIDTVAPQPPPGAEELAAPVVSGAVVVGEIPRPQAGVRGARHRAAGGRGTR
ncbi:tetratricopeptide repeat protein, partial [Mycobacterium sp.]|uniref:tetratricopeptide repeat protein n=1 Tax=Mycobacterium sp. TaxID=1785 RepID=UPI002CB0E84E